MMVKYVCSRTRAGLAREEGIVFPWVCRKGAGGVKSIPRILGHGEVPRLCLSDLSLVSGVGCADLGVAHHHRDQMLVPDPAHRFVLC